MPTYYLTMLLGCLVGGILGITGAGGSIIAVPLLIFGLQLSAAHFSSGLYGEYANHIELRFPYGFYVFNICLTGFFNFLIWRYISSPKSGISNQSISNARRGYGNFRTLVVPFAFLLSFLLSFWVPIAARYAPMLIPVMMRLAAKYYKKKDPNLKY